MNVGQFREVLEANQNASLHIMLPGGEFVPDHFHVTEVGRVEKRFIDCGGTVRHTACCSLQIWTADDHEHRLQAGKLAGIFKMARSLIERDDLPIELEYGSEIAVQYRLADVEVTPKGLLFVLAGRQTECLAPDQCGVGNASGNVSGKACC